MKRSREEYIIAHIPNELIIHVIGTDLKVMAKFSQVSNAMREWLEEQHDLYYQLFKQNFKNVYCLLHDLRLREDDISILFTDFSFSSDDDGFIDKDIECAMHFSSSFEMSHRNFPLSVDTLMDKRFTEIIQCTQLIWNSAEADLVGEVYDQYCSPWDPLIIRQCENDTTFAQKMARLFHTVIHPFGFPDASYYTRYQNDARHVACIIMRTLYNFIVVERADDDDSDDEPSRSSLGPGIAELREELLSFDRIEELEVLFEWGDDSKDEAFGEEDENGVAFCDVDSQTISFIRKLGALPIESLPQKKDAKSIYEWWQTIAVPVIEKLQLKHPDMVPDDWQIEKDPNWDPTVFEEKDDNVLFFDTIDDAVYKKSVVSLFLNHKTNVLPRTDRNVTLSKYKEDFLKDNNLSRLEQRYFRLFLYRLLDYPICYNTKLLSISRVNTILRRTPSLY